MFSRLYKLLTVIGMLFFAFTAKANSRVNKNYVSNHTVKQYLHAGIFAEETSLVSVLTNQASPIQVIPYPADLTEAQFALLKRPDNVLEGTVALHNSRIPRKLSLILFPFHAFW